MNNWNNVVLEPVFNEQGVICYRLEGENYVNEYYVTSEAETRKLLNTPEIVGYEVYQLPDSLHLSDAVLFKRAEKGDHCQYPLDSAGVH